MVDDYYFIFIALAFFGGYSLGRLAGRIEASFVFQERMSLIISSLRKVQQLAELRGEDISKLPPQEVVDRIQKQLEIKDTDE